MPFEMAPPAVSTEERIAMAARCRDCDVVPKAVGAGQVVAGPGGAPVQIMHNGILVEKDGYCGAWMTDLIRICRGHHEPQEERIFHEILPHLPQDGVMLELGGWWAFYSLWFLQGGADRRAIVLEPDTDHLEVGRRNASLNALYPSFASGSVGSEYLPEIAFCGEHSGPITTTQWTVARLMETHDVPHLAMLHLDVQGTELDVLQSCRDLFARRAIDWIFVSTHAFPISGDHLTHQKCLHLLREAGAVIEAEHDVHESFSGDGLIVGRFCGQPAGWTPVELSFNRQSTSLFRGLAYDLAALSG